MKNPSCVLHAARDARLEDTAVAEPAAGEVRLRLKAAGVCGSDLHYYRHGGIGKFTLREPLVLGHEVAATVDAVGTGTEGLSPGQLVAVNPARYCGTCAWCRHGRQNLCPDGFYLGSASKYPHMQGAFRQLFAVSASQCLPAPDGADAQRLALAEPLSVALHALKRAQFQGGNILVIGCGTIGLLIVIAARSEYGGCSITAIDIDPDAADRALAAGATESLVAKDATVASGRAWDLVFEASGTAVGINLALESCARGGRIVQVGAPPADLTLADATSQMFKETDHIYSFRFAGDEFAQAVAKLSGDLGEIASSALGGMAMPLDEAPAALELMTSSKPPAPKMFLVSE